jgi:hypothetical protein
MLWCMASQQLAIRFTEDQIDVIEQAASELGISRSALVKKLVDDLKAIRIASSYAAGYPLGGRNVDDWGDLDAFHDAAARARRENRTADELPW